MKRAWLVGVGALMLPNLAFAQSAPEPSTASAAPADASLDAPIPPGVHVIDDGPTKTPLVPRANDLLSSHVLIGGAVGPTWSLGSLGKSWSSGRALGTGLSFGLDAGYGLSRFTAVGIWGSFATYGDGSGCDTTCAGKALSVGPYVRYHLAQGFRFDPWLTLGGGFRRVTHDDGDARRTFDGIQWLHLELGADYYLFSGLGLGPYASLGASSYWRRPQAAGAASVNTELSFGLRLLFDAPGR